MTTSDTPTKRIHRWNRDGERCENCGDKDWMASPQCPTPHRKVWSTDDGDCFPFTVGHCKTVQGRFVPEGEYQEMIGALTAEREKNAEANETLQFVERWANHHGQKGCITPAEALSCIQHYPPILAITRGYADGKVPDTPNPWALLEAERAKNAKLREEAEAVRGLVEALEKLRDNGTHHDTCPCRRLHENQPVAAEIDGFWLRYAGSMDDRVRQMADAALKAWKGE